MELRMRSSDKGRGILQYVDRFNQLVNQVSDITETEKFTYFNQGLTPELQRLLIPLTHVNTVEDAISMVVRYEMLNQSQENVRGASYSNRSYPNHRPQAPVSSVWSNPGGASYGSSTSTPMELGAMSAEQRSARLDDQTEQDSTEQLLALRNERLTPEQVEQHRRRGLCFHCHQQGHLSRQCPLKGVARK